MTTIIYKKIRHGYARIDKEGNLQITIPSHLKGNEKFEASLLAKGQLLLERYAKQTHIQTSDKDSVLLFGERIPIMDFLEQQGAGNRKQGTGKNLTSKKNPQPKHSTYHLLPATNKLLAEILEEYATPILIAYSKKLWIDITKLIIRKTRSKRWSCTQDQNISLNRDLVHLPTKYIKYVIIHECCHLKIKNHSKKFRALVESFLPDYKITRKEMRKMIVK